MRLEELRSELHAQADRAGDVPMVNRLEQVQGRVHHIRRRRATVTAAGAVAVVALAALAVVPPLHSERSAPGPASGTAKAAHADHPNPWVWRQTVGGDTLALGAVGERGQSTVRKTFVPDETDLSFSAFCDIARRPGAGSGLMMSYSVNGNELGGTGCNDSSDATGGTFGYFKAAAAGNREAWGDLGVRPGRPVTVRLWVENKHRKRVELPDLRLGFALYERTAPRVFQDGVMIPELRDWAGRTYALADYTTQRLTRRQRSATLSVPASDQPRLFTSGLEQQGFEPRSRVQQLVNGNAVSMNVGGGQGTDRLHGDGARTLGVRERNDDVRGTLVIAVYELVADQQSE